MAEAQRRAAALRMGTPPVAPAPDRRRVPRLTQTTVSTAPRQVVINHASTFLVCATDGSMHPDQQGGLGIYADDTRDVVQVRDHTHSYRSRGHNWTGPGSTTILPASA